MRPRPFPFALLITLMLSGSSALFAFVAERAPSRFDQKVIFDPASRIGIRSEMPEELPGFAVETAAWDAFVNESGGDWQVHVDRRSGTPLLVQGAGISWFPADGPFPSLVEIEAKARRFVADHALLFRIDEAQLVLSREGSGPIDRDHWILIFDRAVGGVPVEGQRFILTITRGNLVAFGADRWGRLDRLPTPAFDLTAARQILYGFMGITPADSVTDLAAGKLVFVPAPARATEALPYVGIVGRGTDFHLAYRFSISVANEPGIWVGKVDALTGQVIAFYDDVKYAQTKGGIYQNSNNGICPGGCEQPAYPMPYADVTIGVSPQTANDFGMFSCSPSGGNARTTLAGPYVRISDVCGPVNESVTCDADLDLQQSAGTDCAVPTGGSAGDTHASRTSFYQINRVKEKARAYLPGNSWLDQQLVVNTNINATCNATWGGSLNMYKSGGGCRNTGEIPGVLHHEWGHGLDQNDGGGYDDPTEGYADVNQLIQTHLSCAGPGFYMSGNCDGYGDACLNCSGIRDDDYNQHASHTPVTAAGFVANDCGGGDGPCGREQHCEGYLVGETIWDLAARDLPGAGLDQATAWQVATKLWYKSRQGSGGNAYNCALPSSDGCNVGSWFNRMRNVDDDDGNLSNGTPHAAAIFNAYNRHGIACGLATDASNQNQSSCPSLTAPTLSVAPGADSNSLTWTSIPSASNYLILRNDIGCGASHNIIATVSAPATSTIDSGLPVGFNVFYAVQAQGSNTACESVLSNCVMMAPLPRKGQIVLDDSSYGCSDSLQIRVLDVDLGTLPSVVETIQVTLTSTTETTPELVTLTETGPSTSQFVGTINTAPGASVAHDGILQVANGDLVTASYQDADDGTGHHVVAFKTVLADCAGPDISSVAVTDVTDESAIVRWSTSEPASSRVEWGTTPSLGNIVTDGALVAAHALTLQPFSECGGIYFRVSSTDKQGNARTSDASGSPFSFNSYKIPGIFRDTFESSSGWTLDGEWQIDAPQGRGTVPDPSSAWEGSKVLGHDLTGLGAHSGDYEPGTTQRAISPVINASTLAGGQIKFRRWLHVFGTAGSSIEVRKNGIWNTVWSSPGTIGVSDAAWSLQTIDVSAYADGNASLQIAFKQYGGPAFNTSTRSGWNVDRFVVHSTSTPDFDTCGGCGGAPSFAGLASATDISACADTGIQMSWQNAAAWGSGHAGSYSIYRDTTPNFTPTPANRIATGVSGPSYTDAGAPNGVTLYYLVRAENDETCSTGPKNGGVTDANTAYASARDETSQPAAGSLGSSLRAGGVNDAHVRLTWSPAAGAARYHIRRADAPAASFALIGDVTATFFEDGDELGNATTRYYLVLAADSCGNEGP